MGRETRTLAYGITLYRDDPDAGEANVESRYVGSEPTAGAAIAAAQQAGPATGWQYWSATVDKGEDVSERTRDGIILTCFETPESGDRERWNIGPGWCDHEKWS